MIGNLSALPDRRLDAKTLISLKREPVCFAHLCAPAMMPPLPIDSLHIDFASADCVGGRPSVWATLEIQSPVQDSACSLLGFDETFLRPFSRALIECATTRASYRMCISRIPARDPAREAARDPADAALAGLLAIDDVDGQGRAHVVDYVRSAGTPISDLILAPHEELIMVGTSQRGGSLVDTLFQLPRTGSFLRAFVRTVFEADRALRETITGMEAIERRRARADR